jgi:hypothetical protein
MYEWLGKASVRFAFRYARRRYRREARIALGFGLLAAAIVAYLAGREVPEG